MNKLGKLLLTGFLIWLVPFLASIFTWDPAIGGPIISVPWFNALMVLTFGIGFAIALYLTISEIDSVKEGWVHGLSWFGILAVLDLLVLVVAFGTPLTVYVQILTEYLIVPIITVAIAYGRNK